MKYPFRFTDTCIIDVDKVLTAEILYSSETSILITFKNAEELIISFDTVEDFTQKFEDFCKACADYTLQQQLKGK